MKRRRKIGLLGGSFNPAHEGHRDISLAALAYFGLDEVRWLVAPQNPLKSTDGMAPFATRIALAQAVAAHPRIRVTDIEIRLGTRFTADTLAKLVELDRDCRFLWLMGADNLVQIDHWKNWQQIFHLLPIAVFDRPTYTYRALAAKAARRFAKFRLRESASLKLIEASTPAWMFMHHRLNPISATAIRAEAARADARRAAVKRR
ncbi:MAG: nicotinate-nucleotide adenylyltransferase [Rhodospirillaceae bacterium]|nr:MAG: nicotinate-nucleotide adenylyltransferase [Rhodospirillaceae bacterium]